MAKKCEVCLGTGKFEGMFCACSEGKLLKARQQAEERAEQLAQEEEKQKGKHSKKHYEEVFEETVNAVKNNPSVLFEEEKPPFNVGDWVTLEGGGVNELYRGVKAFVLSVNYRKVTGDALIQMVDADTRGLPNKLEWVKYYNLKAAPIETSKMGQAFMLDQAIATNDEQWFKELTNQKIKGR